MSDASNAAGQLWHRWGRFAAVVVITVVVALGLVAGGLWLYTDHLYRTSYESSYTYDVALNTNETTRVNVMTTVEGQNSWWVFGWSYDYYRDAISVELHGPHGGWMDATGTVEVDTDQRQPPSLLDA
ncbi:hypothetical protein C499_14900 [Halogeometricum borinquense DSM 11551]|uniref:Uncharacterized protein n=1 Tax=Halogeometricum borinquense (strain ATCC 700274 / DSM 11551 / JCM 10706 / KCTC 4070 / PR3) TaxID=469382 RepID=E4NTV4_HALBP|nr:hypothetical protein [Halogeometricum borinquense]ADQ68259.1 hypothetical protein Hbor_27120 [Halogeometricum borinquense DSM 11551]ELY24698.1 hypothetical protein C499_14900 [Halogeometricum borinquense DSM 11551]